MRIFVDTAVPAEIEEWVAHPLVEGVTTNPSLCKAAGIHPRDLVNLTDKPISIDGPPEVHTWGSHVYRKVPLWEDATSTGPTNWTAVCSQHQLIDRKFTETDIVSVFAGRIMDTGRDPGKVIEWAKATGAQVLWASVREPYNLVMAEQAGCDIITVPPAILRKYLDWKDRPLITVAAQTIQQFHDDAKAVTW